MTTVADLIVALGKMPPQADVFFEYEMLYFPLDLLGAPRVERLGAPVSIDGGRPLVDDEDPSGANFVVFGS